jgi:hypothetical protein
MTPQTLPKTMHSFCLRLTWTGLSLVISHGAWASPTPEDYRQCHRMAATVMQRCLDEAPGARHGNQCWEMSRQTQKTCYREMRTSLPPQSAGRRHDSQTKE